MTHMWLPWPRPCYLAQTSTWRTCHPPDGKRHSIPSIHPVTWYQKKIYIYIVGVTLIPFVPTIIYRSKENSVVNIARLRRGIFLKQKVSHPIPNGNRNDYLWTTFLISSVSQNQLFTLPLRNNNRNEDIETKLQTVSNRETYMYDYTNHWW